MLQEEHKCTKVVGGKLQCSLCKGNCIKHGKTKDSVQRYKCLQFGKTFMENYFNKAYIVANKFITALLKEGCGMRSIARLLQISCTTIGQN